MCLKSCDDVAGPVNILSTYNWFVGVCVVQCWNVLRDCCHSNKTLRLLSSQVLGTWQMDWLSIQSHLRCLTLYQYWIECTEVQRWAHISCCFWYCFLIIIYYFLVQTEPWWNCACVVTSLNGRETEIAQGAFLWNGDFRHWDLTLDNPERKGKYLTGKPHINMEKSSLLLKSNPSPFHCPKFS